MFLPSVTGHRGIIIGDLRTPLHHPAYNRCSHWHVAWDTRCARLPDNRMFSVGLQGTAHLPITIADSVLKHAPTGITQGSSASAVGSLVICRPAAQHRTLRFPTNRRAGIYNLITGHNATVTIIRETLRRPGPHPHPPVIFMHHIDLIRPVTGNQYHTYSTTNEVMYGNMHVSQESQEVFSSDAEDHQSSVNMDQTHGTTRPVDKSVDWSIAMDNQHTDEDIMQISGVGHWFLEG